MALADAWDVMTSERPYQRPRSVDEARRECRQLVGVQFCPTVVEALEHELDGSESDAFAG